MVDILGVPQSVMFITSEYWLVTSRSRVCPSRISNVSSLEYNTNTSVFKSMPVEFSCNMMEKSEEFLLLP